METGTAVCEHLDLTAPSLGTTALWGLGPGYLNDHLFKYELVHTLSSDEETLCVLPVAEAWQVVTSRKDFLEVAPSCRTTSPEMPTWHHHWWLLGYSAIKMGF